MHILWERVAMGVVVKSMVLQVVTLTLSIPQEDVKLLVVRVVSVVTLVVEVERAE